MTATMVVGEKSIAVVIFDTAGVDVYQRSFSHHESSGRAHAYEWCNEHGVSDDQVTEIDEDGVTIKLGDN